MTKRIFILFCSFFFITFYADAQNCNGKGQTPSFAIPVCGTKTFSQPLVANCPGNKIASNSSCTIYRSDASYWYKFHCYQSGTLGFIIDGVNVNDDYDWEVFDVTNVDPNKVFSDPTLQVSLNLYGAPPGVTTPFPNTPTGCSSQGNRNVNCEGTVNSSPFNQMPTITAGNDYLLMVTNYSASGLGYSLNFNGGSASITDPLMPHLSNATPTCDGMQLKVKLNKKMKCTSLASDGSDFSINIPGTTITAAATSQCVLGFDMDSVTLSLASILLPGNYTLTIKNGTDGNTLADNCDQLIPDGETVPVIVVPIVPTLLDSITKPTCASQTLELVFKKGIKCNSIAVDGSDFSVTGPVPVTISSVTGNCANGISSKIFVNLSAPLQTGGTYTITLKAGTDGGTLTDECNTVTPPSSLTFNIKDTVNADFTYNILYGCAANSVSYHYPNKNGVNSWKWTIDSIRSSTLQNPIISYSDYKDQNTTLIVSNGFCSDTSSQKITFDNYLNADFEITNLVCPGDLATLKNNSVGNFITSWTWIFGNGKTSPLKDPPNQAYTNPDLGSIAKIPVLLIAHNSFGCNDTAVKYIQVVSNCFIAVPTAFTPNGDGINDYLYPLNAYKALDLKFSIYNRFGQRIFYTTNWTNKWDGRVNGQPADMGTYVWILTYTNSDTHRQVAQKGTSILIR
jgi:gliding motility-associated-like protein